MTDTSYYQCSPALKKGPGDTCLSMGGMQRIAKIWNELHPDDSIQLLSFNKTRRKRKMESNQNQIVSDHQTSPKELWHTIRDKMIHHYKCNTEYCMVKSMPGLSETERKSMLASFRPEKPETWKDKPTTWLDSFNIEDVMKQYEERKDFKFDFIGPVPIDFDKKYGAFGKCIVEELCKLNLEKQKKRGIEHIGIIFNLDPHDKPGSHWVCAFIDITDSAAYYFDSYGYPPPQEVDELFKRCKKQGIQHIYYNDIRHQRKGSECGMYCLITIICLLNGKSFYSICSKIKEDDTVNTFRDILFSTEKPRAESIQKGLASLCI